MRSLLPGALAASVTLLAPHACLGAPVYRAQSIAQSGGQVGNIALDTAPEFEIAGLNERGDVLFQALSATQEGLVLGYTEGRLAVIARQGDRAGDARIDTLALALAGPGDQGEALFVGLDREDDDLLIQSGGVAGAGLTPIVVPGKPAPGGTWQKLGRVLRPLTMNRSGKVAFVASVLTDQGTQSGTFFWDPRVRQVTPIALQGLPAANGITFARGRGSGPPALNERDEIAFLAGVRDEQDEEVRDGVFLRRADGAMVAVALPGGTLPGGARIGNVLRVLLNDAGLVAFLAESQGSGEPGFYLWDQGVLTALVASADAPGGGFSIVDVRAVRMHRKNPTALVVAQLDRDDGPLGLYRFAEGRLTPVAVPGQAMPEGGTLHKSFSQNLISLGPANDAGEHAFLAVLADNTIAAYRVDASGVLSRIAGSGSRTGEGTIRLIYGIAGPNNKGQIALAAEVNTPQGEREALLLLTPATP